MQRLPRCSLPFGFGVVLFGLCACTDPVKSGDYATNELDATYDAACGGTSTVLSAFFELTGGTLLTYVRLDATDSATVTSGDLTEELAELEVGDLVSYVGGLPLYEADTPFVFSLTREVDEGAPNSEVTLPPPFEINGVNPPEGYSRSADTLTVAWTGESAGDPMTMSFSGDCIENYSVDLEDESGSAAVPAGTIVDQSTVSGGTCDVTMTLRRSREGTLDSGFAGGSIDARQERSLSFSSAP